MPFQSTPPARGAPHKANLGAAQYAELTGGGVRTLPATLLDATRELEGWAVLRKAFGRGRDEDYVDYYVRTKQEEWARYHEQVSPWEIKE